MITLHLIRHGETDGNRVSYIGRSDLALNAVGLAQAETVKETLTNIHIDRIYSSPLLRAQQTAQPLADARNLPVILDPDLMEIDFGLLEGKPKSQQGLNLRKAHLTEPLPGGESLEQLGARVVRFLDRLPGDAGNVAIFGHYWTNRVLCALLTPGQSYKPANGEVLTLALDRIPSGMMTVPAL